MSYCPDGAQVKKLPILHTTIRNEFSNKIGLVKIENHQIEFSTLYLNFSITQKLLIESFDQSPKPDGQMVNITAFLRCSRKRQFYESVKLKLVTIVATSLCLLCASRRHGKMGRANALHLNKKSIFDFLK